MSDYIRDADDSKVQSPAPLPVGASGKAVTPASQTVVKSPDYVIINNAGTYAFLYESTASVGSALNQKNPSLDQQSMITGSVMAANQGNLTLPIQPVAWKETGADSAQGATGDVTFVYKGKG